MQHKIKSNSTYIGAGSINEKSSKIITFYFYFIISYQAHEKIIKQINQLNQLNFRYLLISPISLSKILSPIMDTSFGFVICFSVITSNDPNNKNISIVFTKIDGLTSHQTRLFYFLIMESTSFCNFNKSDIDMLRYFGFSK